jgi:hypothetical protein
MDLHNTTESEVRPMYRLSEVATLLSVSTHTLANSPQMIERMGGIKVGQQWRFPRRHVNSVVNGGAA